jgi:di/tricarboxylate transporter
MAASGTADLLARLMLELLTQRRAVVALALLRVVTMFLSDVMNSAATAAVMRPIALGSAAAIGVDADGLLMAVAIDASWEAQINAPGGEVALAARHRYRRRETTVACPGRFDRV